MLKLSWSSLPWFSHALHSISPTPLNVVGSAGGWGWNAVVSLCQSMHLAHFPPLWYRFSTNDSPSGVSLLWVLLFLKSVWAGVSHSLLGIFWLALRGWGFWSILGCSHPYQSYLEAAMRQLLHMATCSLAIETLLNTDLLPLVPLTDTNGVFSWIISVCVFVFHS